MSGESVKIHSSARASDNKGPKNTLCAEALSHGWSSSFMCSMLRKDANSFSLVAQLVYFFSKTFFRVKPPMEVHRASGMEARGSKSMTERKAGREADLSCRSTCCSALVQANSRGMVQVLIGG